MANSTLRMSKTAAIRQVLNTLQMLSPEREPDIGTVFDSLKETFPELIDYNDSAEIYRLMACITSVLYKGDPTRRPVRRKAASGDEILRALMSTLENYPSIDMLRETLQESLCLFNLCGGSMETLEKYLTVLEAARRN